MGQEPDPDYTPDEDRRVVHYGPGDRPLCGNDSVTAVYTDDPNQVQGCEDCLELVAEGLQDHTHTWVAACTAGGRSPPRAE